MDCMHFTLRDITTREQAFIKANTVARTFFGHDAFDIELEATSEEWLNGELNPWKVEVTVRTWNYDE